jgi:hypothetical protein
MRYLLSFGHYIHRVVTKLFDQGIAALLGEFDEIDESRQEVDRAFPLRMRDIAGAEIIDSCSFRKS